MQKLTWSQQQSYELSVQGLLRKLLLSWLLLSSIFFQKYMWYFLSAPFHFTVSFCFFFFIYQIWNLISIYIFFVEICDRNLEKWNGFWFLNKIFWNLLTIFPKKIKTKFFIFIFSKFKSVFSYFFLKFMVFSFKMLENLEKYQIRRLRVGSDRVNKLGCEWVIFYINWKRGNIVYLRVTFLLNIFMGVYINSGSTNNLGHEIVGQLQ